MHLQALAKIHFYYHSQFEYDERERARDNEQRLPNHSFSFGSFVSFFPRAMSLLSLDTTKQSRAGEKKIYINVRKERERDRENIAGDPNV